MALPVLVVRTRDGRVRTDGATRAVLFLGRLDIGGSGFPQAGFVEDARLAWPGRSPMTFLLAGGLVGLDPWTAAISIEGSRVHWHYPAASDRAFERPRASILYGSF